MSGFTVVDLDDWPIGYVSDVPKVGEELVVEYRYKKLHRRVIKISETRMGDPKIETEPVQQPNIQQGSEII